jgi:hypothetical protein
MSKLAVGGDFTQTATIEKTYTSVDWTQVTLAGTAINPDGCTSSAYYAIDITSSNYDGILSSILTAQMAQKPVLFWVSGCAGSNDQYPEIVSIQVLN